MKKLAIISLLAASALLQTSCAVSEGISSACNGSDIEAACDFLFGYKDRQQDNRINDNRDSLNFITRELGEEIRELETLIRENDENMQLELNAMQAQLTYYSTLIPVISLIDPCDDFPGHYDEVIMRLQEGNTDSGRLVAFFEDGKGRRFLTVLKPGVVYQTTDAQKCKFKINEFNQIEEL